MRARENKEWDEKKDGETLWGFHAQLPTAKINHNIIFLYSFTDAWTPQLRLDQLMKQHNHYQLFELLKVLLHLFKV